MKTRIKNFILYGLMFILLASVAYSIRIQGFEELRYDGALIINSTSLSIKTSNTARMFVDSGGLVGMGTITPTEKLVVMGNLSINNSAHGGITFFVDSTNNRTGIGTASPSHTLTVIGDLNVTGVSYLGDITINTDNITTNNIVSRNGNISLFNDSGDELMRITSLGKVGIGTTNPTETLSVIGNFSVSGNHSFFGGLNIGGDLVGTDGVGPNAVSSGWVDDGSVVRLIDATNKVGIGTASPQNVLDVEGAAVIGATYSGTNTAPSNGLLVEGNVGIGTASPLQTLVVVGTVNITDSLNVSGTVQATTFIGSGGSLTGITSSTSVWNSTGSNVYLNDSTASVGIGTTSPTHQLHVVGDANITNNLYLGQNLTDLAENIFSAEDVEAGDVVVISDDMKVIKSYKAYDKKAVGVISTAPAATFGGSTGNVPLAISGRVPVKVTDENGPIDPGDLLTTSSTLGHAMKCNDYEKCFGNIIGKAITPLEQKIGVVTMMIMLN